MVQHSEGEKSDYWYMFKKRVFYRHTQLDIFQPLATHLMLCSPKGNMSKVDIYVGISLKRSTGNWCTLHLCRKYKTRRRRIWPNCRIYSSLVGRRRVKCPLQTLGSAASWFQRHVVVTHSHCRQSVIRRCQILELGHFAPGWQERDSTADLQLTFAPFAFV